MGNCVSATGQKGFLKNMQAASGGVLVGDAHHYPHHADSFQVFVKKRNKFIPGTLKITENEIVFLRSRCETLNWPLHFLRRYGYTSAGFFFFESGRRCISGEGLHTFQSHQAEAIFQLLQSRIQDNANMGIAIRDANAHSISGSLHSVHNMPAGGYPGARIQPIQRYSSEGTTVNIGGNSSQSYNSYRRPFNRFNYHQHLMSQASRRPRSIADPANHTITCHMFSANDQAHRFCPNQPAFIGSVVNERVLHRQPSELSCFNHSYVNVSPQNRSATSSPQCFAPTLGRFSSNGHFSVCSTEKANIDECACNNSQSFNGKSTIFNRFAYSINSVPEEKVPLKQYVNTVQDLRSNDHEQNSSHLDYASLTVGSGDESSQQSTMRSSIGIRSELPPLAASPSVNYAKIDLDKTHAVQVAASTAEKQNPHRRLYMTNV